MLYLHCLFAGHILNVQLMSQYLCLENCVLVTDYSIDQGDGNLRPVGQIHFNTYLLYNSQSKNGFCFKSYKKSK